MKKSLVALAISATCSSAWAANDFGAKVEHLLHAQSFKYFGIARPLAHSASSNTPRQSGQAASDVVDVAPGLHASYLTRDAANWSDQIAFWPDADNPSYLFTGVENFNPFTDDNGDAQACLQRIDLTTGQIDIVLRGGLGCDGVRVTPWGTVVVAEEQADGALYEVLDPTTTTEVTITDRASGTSTDPAAVAKRGAMGLKSWEGMALLPSGVAYFGDELRPGDRRDASNTRIPNADGGAIYKFVPTAAPAGGTIASLADSPLAAGALYALQVSCREVDSSRFPQFGQGCEVGDAAWVKIEDPANARAEADAKGATGYYRPEDLHLDPNDPTRFCWANTQREKAHSYGEVLCASDNNPTAHAELVDNRTGHAYLAENGQFASAVVTRFIEGNPELNSVDNLAFQPGTGILYVVEDHKNGDVWACLPDGADENEQSDGCVRVLSIKDQSAEPTGFIFTGNGRRAYLNIQHSDDTNRPDRVNGVSTDDVIQIDGFRILPSMRR